MFKKMSFIRLWVCMFCILMIIDIGHTSELKFNPDGKVGTIIYSPTIAIENGILDKDLINILIPISEYMSVGFGYNNSVWNFSHRFFEYPNLNLNRFWFGNISDGRYGHYPIREYRMRIDLFTDKINSNSRDINPDGKIGKLAIFEEIGILGNSITSIATMNMAFKLILPISKKKSVFFLSDYIVYRDCGEDWFMGLETYRFGYNIYTKGLDTANNKNNRNGKIGEFIFSPTLEYQRDSGSRLITPYINLSLPISKYLTLNSELNIFSFYPDFDDGFGMVFYFNMSLRYLINVYLTF